MAEAATPTDVQTTEDCQTTRSTVQTTADSHTTRSTVQTTEDCQTTRSTVQTTEDCQTTRSTVQTTEDSQTTMSTVQTTEDSQTTRSTVQTTEDCQTTRSTVQTTADCWKTGSATASSMESSSNISPAESVIYSKIIASDKTIQSQQRGEPELTPTQKYAILHSLLRTKPGSFLMRFGSLLDGSDLSYIESVATVDYEVEYRLKVLRKQLGLSLKSRRKQVQNRRYQYLQHLMENSSYFSEEEMRNRNPLLYEEYIGQYMTTEEKDDLDMGDRSDVTLSGLILKKMEIDKRRDLYHWQQELESSQLEESDSDESDEEDMDMNEDHVEIDSEQREQYREDYLRAMQLSFLNGEDKDFDYSKVDVSEAFDPLDMLGRDAEDAYFDDEEPVDISDCELVPDSDTCR